MTDSLHIDPEPDGFKSESPIRAFTEFTINGHYAIGKGFRPSLAHLTTYLDAMLKKEGWRLVQVLEAATSHPSMLFAKDNTERFPLTFIQTISSKDLRSALSETRTVADAMKEFTKGDLGEPFKPGETLGVAAVYVDDKEVASERRSTPAEQERAFEIAREMAEEEAADPINPAHYGGRACADIGERLSANGYQILKYCWRLGKKDDPVQELGKALWYAESERRLLGTYGVRHVVRPDTGLLNEYVSPWFNSRIEGQSEFTQAVARLLWGGYCYQTIGRIIQVIQEHRNSLDRGRGLAI